jgi:DNA-directed RNA polymerase subunit RPC12/RpoP
VTEPKQYRSNYEYKCVKCGQSIKPRTPYILHKKYENFRGERVLILERIHIKCPEETLEDENTTYTKTRDILP